jgi:single-stranded DNA-binding protein
MNTLILEGRTTKDFIKRNDMAYSSIAVKRQNGTMFVDVICFGKVADYCVSNVAKGSRIVAEGELNIVEKDGKRFVSCSAKNIINCGRKETTDEKPQAQSEPKEDMVDISDDDLPF